MLGLGLDYYVPRRVRNVVELFLGQGIYLRLPLGQRLRERERGVVG